MKEKKECIEIIAALKETEQVLNSILREREEVIRALMLALLSGEHLYLIGPPGTGKSLLIRKTAERFSGLCYFERLLHHESDRESLSGLASQTGISRASLVFLDEILRAPKSLLLTLLSFMNERIWHDPDPEPAKLITLFAASNAHPSQSDHLDAFFDRFALRCLVEPLRQFQSFSDLLLETAPCITPSVSFDRFTMESFNMLHEYLVLNVTIDLHTVQKLWDLRLQLGREGINLSDRRWKMVVKVLKAIALYEGDHHVDEKHLAGLLPVLWTYPPEIRGIRRLLSEFK